MDAIDTLTKFMSAWKDSNWSEMLKSTQKTWRSKKNNDSELLKNWFYLKDLLTFKVLKIDQISDSCVDVLLSIRYIFGDSKLKETKIRARVICETEPYKPSKTGEWGINPIGMLREFKS
ncbi:MAG TPA: hypothetical protein VMZ91_03015 [Candidatus Paceibacterota bacterium]|nr:hypothetical protein [Candidatus Paceibacterota bacterium]